MRGIPKDGRRARWGSTVAERLALHSRTDPATGCILWTGATHDARGYCRMGVARRMRYVHILAWELVNGPVPQGMVLRHSCDTPPCLNVAHLKPGTQRENIADMFTRGRTNRRGERNNSAQLTWARVRKIRSLHADGATTTELSMQFGVSKSQIRNVVQLRHWKEVS